MCLTDRVFRKAINANLGLKVNWGTIFSFIKMLKFSTADVLCSLTLLELKREGEII